MNSVYSLKRNILAPMVHAGRTPLRVLALSYGADLVYTEEIVDQRLLASKRVKNASLATVDYLLGDEVVLRIADEERAHCVLQIGSNSAENAAKVCEKVGTDVAAIDLNMGCPKPFSIHCGMGAALLSQSDKVKQILTAMVSAAAVPVSCKIRVLDSQDDTMQFVRMIEGCGVSALAVHGRRRDERPKDQCRIDEIRQICGALSIPVFANGHSGQIQSNEDIARFRDATGASGVMLARRALARPSIFCADGILSMENEIHNFLQKAWQYDECFTGLKYVVQRILGSQQTFDPRGRGTVSASTTRQIYNIWDVDISAANNSTKRGSAFICQDNDGLDVVETTAEDNAAATQKLAEENGGAKRPRNDDDLETEQYKDGDGIGMKMVDGVHVARITFHPKQLKCGLNGKLTPKCVLNRHCVQQQFDAPIFQTKRIDPDHRFSCIVSVNGRKFGSPVTQPNIKMAEQVAALVALHGLNVRHKLEGDWEEQ